MPKQLTAWKDDSGRLYKSFEAAHRAELTNTLNSEIRHEYSSDFSLTIYEFIKKISHNPQPLVDILTKYIAGLDTKEPKPCPHA